MQAFKAKIDYPHMLLVFMLVIIFVNPFNISIYFLLFLSMYIVLKESVKNVFDALFSNIQFWILFLFCMIYATVQFIYQYISIMSFIEYLIYPVLFYIFGSIFMKRTKNEKQIMYYLYAVILSFALSGILSVFFSLRAYGFVSSSLQKQVGIIPWFGNLELSSTVIGTYLSLGIALSGLLFVKTNIYLKALNALIFLLSLFSTILLAHRTGLIIAVSSVILIVFTQMRLNSIANKIKIAFLTIVQFSLLVILFNKNVFNVKLLWLRSKALERFLTGELYHNPRTVAWVEALNGLLTDPLGGKRAPLSLLYAHNLWLDVGWTTGLFSFILLVFFTFITLKNYIIIIKNVEKSLYFKYLVTTMIISFLLTSFVEPVIEANFLFFCSFCFFSGIISLLNTQNNSF